MAEEYFTNDRVKEHKGYRLVSTDPFGFWHIEHPQGNIAKELKDSEYTDWSLAARKVDQYLAAQEAKENRPPLDKNTRKVQEILKGTKE